MLLINLDFIEQINSAALLASYTEHEPESISHQHQRFYGFQVATSLTPCGDQQG